jgi:2-keto-4-pentenoate hydratase/2-oxohepta-3-ene-1,7-dioic acid hydratase in catechol pathway
MMRSVNQIGSVYCIGRNFALHAKELKNEIPAEPVVFLKPASSVVGSDAAILIPKGVAELHHEGEAVLRIDGAPEDASDDSAWRCIGGIASGIDVTARDLQSIAKTKGLPWVLAKGQKTFAPVGPFLSLDGRPFEFEVKLWVNGELKQSGVSSDLIFSIPQIIRYLDEKFGLRSGDLIFTGTPSGVGPLVDSDRVAVQIDVKVSEKSTKQSRLEIVTRSS